MFSRVQFFATPWTINFQAPLSMGLSRQEYCSGVPFPPTGDLPVPGNEPASPRPLHCSQILYHWATWKRDTKAVNENLPEMRSCLKSLPSSENLRKLLGHHIARYRASTRTNSPLFLRQMILHCKSIR